MKKLFTLVSCLICAAMLATTGFAATSTSDAYKMYQEAAKSMDAATSVEMSGATKTTMEMDGKDQGTTTQQFIMRVLEPSSPKNMQMAMQSKDINTNQLIEIYYKDGYMYTKAGNEKIRIKLDLEDIASQTGSFYSDLPKEFFDDAVVEKVEDGTRIKLKMKLSDLEKASGVSVMDELAKSLDDADIKFSTFNYSMVIGSDNKLKSYSVSFNMTMEIEGTTVKAKSSTRYKILSVNEVKKIDFPADLTSYKTV